MDETLRFGLWLAGIGTVAIVASAIFVGPETPRVPLAEEEIILFPHDRAMQIIANEEMTVHQKNLALSDLHLQHKQRLLEKYNRLVK